MIAGLYKRLYKDFNILDFADRLKIQKYVYILQSRGIGLGYFFNFYLYGPYSTDLTRTAYQIEKFPDVKPLKFKDAKTEKEFVSTLTLLETYKDDIKWLECASSVLFLRELGLEKETIYHQIKGKRTLFDDSYINKVWGELLEWKWIND